MASLSSYIIYSFVVFSVILIDEEDVLCVQPRQLLQDIHIGGLFEEGNSSAAIAFQAAVRYVNQRGLIPGKRLVPRFSVVPPHDSFRVERVLRNITQEEVLGPKETAGMEKSSGVSDWAMDDDLNKTVCEMSSRGVAGIFGPGSAVTSRHVQSLCDSLEVPHFSARWDISMRRSSCLLNLYPHQYALSKAVTDIVKAWDWTGFTVLYDSYESLLKVQELIKLADDKGFLVAVRQLVHEPESGYRTVLREVQFSEEKNIVLECSSEILYQVLLEAQQVGLMGKTFSYIITNLDFHTIDYTPFRWGGTNITTLRLVNPDKPHVEEMLELWKNYSLEQEQEEEEYSYELEEYEVEPGRLEARPGRLPNISSPIPLTPTTESGLIFDAVLLFAKALKHFDMMAEMKLECGQGASWFYGYSIINYMRLSELEGMSGPVRFDHEGFRTEIELDIYELSIDGLNRKGLWNGTLHINKPKPRGRMTDDGEDLRNVTFTVLIALTHPYNMLKQDSKALKGNDRYEGFGVELIHELSLMSGFNYTFKEHTDKNSGNPRNLSDGTRVWDGLIGEVLAGRADLAIADITITDERLRDADFTHPFMDLGISILHRIPTKARPSLFSFLDPFSSEVWAYMMSAYVGVSLLLFVMGRISPYEWTNPYPCIQEPEALENQFSLINSFWFTVGSVMQQGSDVAPIAASTRLVASIWWFFTLIMVSSYTAQLASFLTVENVVEPFTDIKELANQNIIKYGAKKNGSTDNFFRDSKDPIHKKIHRFMKENPDCMMENNNEGVKRVLAEPNYAFFMEDTSIEYEVQRQCNLTQVGKRLDNKGYGIVLRQNSTYRNVLSKDIVKMQEKGKLQVMKDKWWKEKRGGGACSSSGDGSSATELKLENTGGVFVVLLGGCTFGVVIAIIEILWDVSQRDNKISFRDELKEELKFIMQCRAAVKPVRNYSLTSSNLQDHTAGSSKESAISY